MLNLAESNANRSNNHNFVDVKKSKSDRKGYKLYQPLWILLYYDDR